MPDQLARLKPYNPNRGHKLRRFMIQGIRFDADKGWYKVSEAMADTLKEVHQDYYDEDSPLAFDIMTQAEAIALETREAEKAERRAVAASPHHTASTAKAVGGAGKGDLTTADLSGKSDDSEDAGEEEAPAAKSKPSTSKRKPRRS